ncbi:MAG: PqqD family protein [bacterium]
MYKLMKFKKTKKLAHRIIKGEAFVLDASSQTLHSMNPSGTRIWELIDGSRTAGDIAQIIQEEFEVESGTAIKDVLEFLCELLEKGLVEKCI